MRGKWSRFILGALFLLLPCCALGASGVIVGVNVVGPDKLSPDQQDALIAELRKAEVKVIRTGMVNDNYTEFIIKAYKAGIGTVGLVLPEQIQAGKQKSPADRSIGRNWGVPGLSDVDAAAATAVFASHLATLDQAGVRLVGIEVGNEFNTSAYNGDFKLPGEGRVLGISDLNNRNNPEGQALAAGFRNYIKVLTGIKEVRNRSAVNKSTPIISGGLADIGSAGSMKPGKKTDYVAINDTIQYLRQNGLDKLVDGYGVHTYPDSDPRKSTPERASMLEERGVVSACQPGTKPCWITEWGFSNASKSSPIDDSKRAKLMGLERNAFKQLAQQGRLAAILYYSWAGMPKDSGSESEWAVYRCGALTHAGSWALRSL